MEHFNGFKPESHPLPLSPTEVAELRRQFGSNTIETGKRKPWYRILLAAVVHPFNILLILLAAASGGTGDIDTMSIMLTMVALSSVIRFHQEWKSYRAALGLLSLVSKKVRVIRYVDANKQGDPQECDLQTDDLVPGDWVKLEPGNLMPADVILLKSKDLYVSQASLTGEAIPVEKYPPNFPNSNGHSEVAIAIPMDNSGFKTKGPQPQKVVGKNKYKLHNIVRNIFGVQRKLEKIDPSSEKANLKMKANLDRPDMCFMGTSVVTGVATAIVHATGSRTYFGVMAAEIATQGPQNAFQLGVRRISWIFFLTMSCLVPPVLLLQGFLNKDWTAALLFALSVAVGLTPEMLPMIVNTTLAKGAYQLAQRKCIVKSLDAVVNLGGMDIICTDKTGTLTKSVVTLSKYVNPLGEDSEIPLHFAYLNSCFQSVQKNPMDTAVLLFYDTFQFQGGKSVLINSDLIVPANIAQHYDKIDEIPFDFTRRRTSVVLRDKHIKENNSELIMICKGSTEETLSVCTRIFHGRNRTIPSTNFEIPDDTKIYSMTDETISEMRDMSEKLSEEGLRVLAVSYKKISQEQVTFSTSDENDLIFVGFIAFLDPPKESTKSVIKSLLTNNVRIKVLTGDSSVVCRKICQEIELPVENIVTSKDLDGLNENEISQLAERSTIFSKLTPIQKADIIRALRRSGHIVGFLGDGINDSPALVEADVGISVDSGTDIAKESADIILLEKNLEVVGEGVIIGRSTFGNTLKYIVMAVSSNFGNVFSMLVASSWLPFLPMLPIHVVVQNLLYDISQIAIPWDHMDAEFLAVPHKWSMTSVLRFMVWMGPWSSVFDITTFAFMWFYFDIKTPEDNVTLFQTTWFTVGLLTQTLIVHMIRTPKIPFVQSTASAPLVIMTVLIMGIGLSLPYIPWLRDWLQMTELEPMVYPYIAGALLCYAVAAQLAKVLYTRLFHKWF